MRLGCETAVANKGFNPALAQNLDALFNVFGDNRFGFWYF